MPKNVKPPEVKTIGVGSEVMLQLAEASEPIRAKITHLFEDRIALIAWESDLYPPDLEEKASAESRGLAWTPPPKQHHEVSAFHRDDPRGKNRDLWWEVSERA